MGNEQSTLAKHDYVLEKTETNLDPEMPFVATKGDEKFLIKMFPLNPASKILQSFREIHEEYHYVASEYCGGGSLADKIQKMNEPPQEFEILIWIGEICMALRDIHKKGLLQKDLTPKDIHFTEFGILRLGGYQKVYENLKHTTTKKSSTELSYVAPEVFLEGTYDVKSDIWAVGCILFELCTLQPAFSAESRIELMPKILGGPYPTLPAKFSEGIRNLLNHIFIKNPEQRPTTSEILECPLIINCFIEKTKISLDEVQTEVDALRALANGLERVHQGATIGSLTGGVIGAVGGITSTVGLILAPLTLGVSLIVTGVGVGIAAVGGVTAGASNITNMVIQSIDRKAVRNVIKAIAQKIITSVTWLQEINNSLQTVRSRCEPSEGGKLNMENVVRLGTWAIRGLGGVSKLLRLLEVVSVGRLAAQQSKVARVAKTVRGVLSALLVAADIFFITMDAIEIHYIRQAKAAESEAARNEDLTTFDDAKLLIGGSEPDTSQSQNQSPPENTQVKSEIMKFVLSIRQAADNLQKVLDELKSIIQSMTSPEDERQQLK